MMSRDDAERFLHDVLREMEEAGTSREYRAQFEDAIDALANTLPPVVGAKEAADLLGMLSTNLGKLRPPLEPAKGPDGEPTVVSGRVPVFLLSDVMAAKERRAR